MYDYDVEALSLVVPPPSAVVTSYRPAVLIRNNGVHDALASGYMRIYDAAGLLIFTTEVYSATITPGTTGLAQGSDYWTPPAVGRYMVYGYISCPLDQFEPNNNLAPCSVDVTGLPPPTPPPVPLHAAQHEEDGADEVSIDGLKGQAADPQNPLPHVSRHQAGGSDELNVGGLLGELAADQPTKTHSNSKHDPQMATASALSAHAGQAAVHTAATNLANRDTSGPRVGLVPHAQLAAGTVAPDPDQSTDLFALRFDGLWGPTEPKRHASSHATDAADPIPSLCPSGLICLWPNAGPPPLNWSAITISIPPPPGYIYITYN